MKLLTTKKAIITMLSLGTVVFAGTIRDINSRSVNKNHAVTELPPVERYLASDEVSVQKVAVMKVAMNEAYKINAKWEVTRIIGADEVITYDKANNADDAKKSIIVPMKLISNSKVMVNNDQGLVYNISLLSNFGTIAIFKKIGNGYEILEAKMIKEEVKKEIVSEEVELVLERAINQTKSQGVLTGSDVSGELLLTKESIEGLRVSLTNGNGEVQNLDIPSAQLMDGGAFKADVDGEEVAGVIFNNGKEGYRLSFVTGPLAGAMLNFVTKETFDELQNKAYDQDFSYDDNRDEVVNDEVVAAQENTIQERVEMNDVAQIEADFVLTPNEIEETVETQGFSF